MTVGPHLARTPTPPHCDPGWNILDFIVVTTGYLAFTTFGNYTAIRGIRALRPLRTITRVKELKVGMCRSEHPAARNRLEPCSRCRLTLPLLTHHLRTFLDLSPW
jgi:hypothetical protein